VGLGNPGARYENTRHNIGFLVLQRILAPSFGLNFKKDPRGLSAQTQIGDAEVHFLMPQTYMNLSAEAVAPYLKDLNIPLSHVLVIYDDLDIPFGQMKFRALGSSGGHQGVESLLTSLRLDGFHRLRIGIGRPDPGREAADHVLEEFSEKEARALPGLLKQAGEAIGAWLEGGSKQVRDILSQQSPKKP